MQNFVEEDDNFLPEELLNKLSKYTANITINIPETQQNVFEFTIPRALEYVDLYGFSQSMFGSILSGTAAPDQQLTDLASGTISFATTIQPNSVALGTDTTGNYVSGITSGNGISVSGTAG